MDRETMIALDRAYVRIENQVEFEKGKVKIQADDHSPLHYWEPGKLYNSKQELVWATGGEFDEDVDDFSKQAARSLEAIIQYMEQVDPADKERVESKFNLYMKGGKAETSGLTITYGESSLSNGGNQVLWNPYAGIYMANQDKALPPFIILYHEIVHSYLTFQMGKEKKERFFASKCDTECEKNWGDAEEKEVIQRHEVPLSKAAGFGVRTGYGGTGNAGEFLTHDIWGYNIEDGSARFLLQAVQPEFTYYTNDPLSHDPVESAQEEIEIARRLFEAGANNDVTIYRFEEGDDRAKNGPGIYFFDAPKGSWELLISEEKKAKQ